MRRASRGLVDPPVIGVSLATQFHALQIRPRVDAPTLTGMAECELLRPAVGAQDRVSSITVLAIRCIPALAAIHGMDTF